MTTAAYKPTSDARKYTAIIRGLERRLEHLEDIVSNTEQSLKMAKCELRYTKQRMVDVSRQFIAHYETKINDLQIDLIVFRELNNVEDNTIFSSVDMDQQPELHHEVLQQASDIQNMTDDNSLNTVVDTDSCN